MIDIFKEDSTGMVIALDNLSKANLSNISNEIVKTSIDGGYEDPIEAYVKAKGVAEIADQIMNGLKHYAIQDAYKFDKDQKVLGCSVVVKNTPTTYDYSHNDEWSEINDQIAQLKERQKEIEKQMIQAMSVAQLIDNDGVVVEPALIKKSGSETIQITIPK